MDISDDPGLTTEDAAEAIADLNGVPPREEEAPPREPPRQYDRQAERIEELTNPHPQLDHEPALPPQPMPPAQRQAQIQQAEHVTAQQMLELEAREEALAQLHASTPWEQLRASDPDRWVAARQQFIEARDHLQKQRETIEGTAAQITHAAQTVAYEQHMAKERAAMLRVTPELKEEGERVRLAEFLHGKGFTLDEIAGAADHRLMALAYQAMRAEKGAARSQERRGIRVKKKTGPKLTPVQQQIKERNLNPHSQEAAAMKIAAIR
jgi:hypothetical protein